MPPGSATCAADLKNFALAEYAALISTLNRYRNLLQLPAS